MFLDEYGRGAISTRQLPGDRKTDDAGAYHLRSNMSSAGCSSLDRINGGLLHV